MAYDPPVVSREPLTDAAAHRLVADVCSVHHLRPHDVALRALRSAGGCAVWLLDDALARIDDGTLKTARDVLPYLQAARRQITAMLVPRG